ncbi:uncharacterized protein LOC135200929 [Macrobrachium nipponense]|uniref:uncharacterized protein LOC135200929 n=1 Tax=Macrobrachium nipponense TaxID=159736 RepID=UPI0030C80FAD
MPANASSIARLLIAVVLLTHRWSPSEGHHHHQHRYPQDFVGEVDHAPKESDDVLWIMGDGGQPVSGLQSLLERIIYNRNKLTNQMEMNAHQLDSETNERDSMASTEDNQQSPRIPQTTSPRTFAKRGIGLISLAVALAQNNTSYSKPRMQPVDLSAYPRRARFFIATMG